MSTDAMRAAALKIVAAYDAYRHRGVAPAPGEYAGVVAAIEEARAALAQPVSAERVPLTDEQLTDIWNASLLKSQSVYAFARAIERAHGIAC